MIKRTSWITFAAFCLITPAWADPIWITMADVSVYGFSTFDQLFNEGINGNSSNDFLLMDQLDGFTVNSTGQSVAERGELQAFGSYVIQPPVPLPPCAPPCSEFLGPGVNINSIWTELSVHPVSMGSANLLADVAGYEVTFNVDGTISPIGRGVGVLDSTATQNGISTYFPASIAIFLASLTGPVSIPLQPADPLSPFVMSFTLGTGTVNSRNLSSTADFSAAFASLEALDSQGNVIPGIALESSDGVMFGSSGITYPTATPSTVPEPSSWILTCGGLSVIGGLKLLRRRINGRQTGEKNNMSAPDLSSFVQSTKIT